VHNERRPVLPIVPNVFEQVQRFSQTVLALVFNEHQIETVTRGDKDDRSDIVEALDPLSSFFTLAAHVEHTTKTGACRLTFVAVHRSKYVLEAHAFNGKDCFVDA
jgi:hypothetical protein